jgi:hypothetical protein
MSGGDSPIARLVGRVEAEDVVRLGIVLHLLEGRAKVVGVEEQLAAGIAASVPSVSCELKFAFSCAASRRAAVGRVAAQAALAASPTGGSACRPRVSTL